MQALIMVLKKLSADSDSRVDDKLLEIVIEEQDEIAALILNEARKLLWKRNQSNANQNRGIEPWKLL